MTDHTRILYPKDGPNFFPNLNIIYQFANLHFDIQIVNHRFHSPHKMHSSSPNLQVQPTQHTRHTSMQQVQHAIEFQILLKEEKTNVRMLTENIMSQSARRISQEVLIFHLLQ